MSKNFYGAFAVAERVCADHDWGYFHPDLAVTLNSTAPWRFTDCVIHYAYQTEPGGVIHRPANISCKFMIDYMLRSSPPLTKYTYVFDLGYIFSSYLDLWGHVTVRFDHVDWNAPDFSYYCPVGSSPYC